MNRREFIKSGTVVAATVSGSAVAVAGSSATGNQHAANLAPTDQLVLQVSSPWKNDITGAGDICQRVLRRITTLSAGRITFAHNEASSHAGRAHQITFGTEHEQLPHHPAFAYFAGLPGNDGLSAMNFKNWLETAGGQSLWADLTAAHGYYPLACGHLGATPPLWSRTPISSTMDLRDRRMVVAGLSAAVAKGLGADTIAGAAAINDPATAISTDRADIAEAGGLYYAMQTNIHKSATFATTNSLSSSGTSLTMRVALPVWEKLSSADQAIFTSAAAEIFASTVTETRMQDGMVRKALERHHTITFTPLPGEAVTAINQISSAVIAHTGSFDETARRIDASYMTFKDLSQPPLTG